MPLTDILKKTSIIPDLSAKDKFAAIEKLVKKLVDNGEIPPQNYNLIVSEVILREKLMPTGIDYGVAIPHAILSNLETEIAAFGRANPSLDFQAQDGKPADLIFLLLIPQDPITPHIKTLSRIVRLFSNEEKRLALRQALSVEDIYKVFD